MDLWNRGNLGALFFGVAAWLSVIVLAPDSATFGLLGKLFLFAPLVVMPIVLLLARTPDRNGRDPFLYRSAVLFQPSAAASVLASFFFPSGPSAAVLATAWFAFTLILALWGLSRFLSRGPAPLEEACMDVGLIYFAVGGGWIVLSRLGLQPLGFNDIIVLLTAIHFHFAGGALQILAGLAGRAIFDGSSPSMFMRKLYSISVAGVLAGPPLLAAGITFSPLLEWVAALVLASSVVGLAGLFLTLLGRKLPVLSKVLLMTAVSSVAVTMTFACVYAYGEWTGHTFLSINYMAQVHGIGNAFGFILCGLLAFWKMKPASRACRTGIPFSRLSSRGSTGTDYFQRIRAVREEAFGTASCPTGLVDDMKDYDRDDFRTEGIHPDIRAFYEKTKDYRLTVVPHWTRGFRWSGRLYRRWAERVGQMCLPVSAQGAAAQLIHSVILPLRDEVDGRQNVRAWVRTYAATGKPVYVAAYAAHREKGCTYMNIAFPLPFGNLTSILRLESAPSGGLSLTSLPAGPEGNDQGDEGVYFVTRGMPIRLPINETISVTVSAPEGGLVTARHDMWIFGIKFLTLDYSIALD